MKSSLSPPTHPFCLSTSGSPHSHLFLSVCLSLSCISGFHSPSWMPLEACYCFHHLYKIKQKRNIPFSYSPIFLFSNPAKLSKRKLSSYSFHVFASLLPSPGSIPTAALAPAHHPPPLSHLQLRCPLPLPQTVSPPQTHTATSTLTL